MTNYINYGNRIYYQNNILIKFGNKISTMTS